MNMKKIFLLVIAATLLIFSSCGNKKAVEMTNEADSLSYNIGYLVGTQQLNFIKQIDSTKISVYKKHIEKGFKGTKEESENAQMGTSLGIFIYGQLCKDGFINGDSALMADYDEIKRGIFDALDKKESELDDNQIREFINDTFKKAMNKQEITTDDVKKLNYYIVYSDVKNIMNQNVINSDPKEIEKFKKAFSDVNADNYIEKQAFFVGNEIANNISKDESLFDLNTVCNIELVKRGVIDAFDKDETYTTLEKSQEFVQSFQMKKYLQAQQKIQEENALLYSDNKKQGEDFLATNKERPEVKTTESGLQYEIIKQGKGKTPTATDMVKVHYHGTLIDGTVFDSSIERNEPATFGVSQVIKGWTEALQLMPVGSKWKLYIPYDLAYGDREVSETIKPFSTLIFEVELLDIVEEEK